MPPRSLTHDPRLQSWGLRHALHRDTDEGMLRDLRSVSRHGIGNFRTHTHTMKRSDGWTIYGTRPAISNVDPGDIWSACLAAPAAFHRPPGVSVGSFSVKVCAVGGGVVQPWWNKAFLTPPATPCQVSSMVVVPPTIHSMVHGASPPQLTVVENVFVTGPEVAAAYTQPLTCACHVTAYQR